MRSMKKNCSHSQIENHNEVIENILDEFQFRVDEMKKDVKRKLDEKNKDLRIKARIRKS